MSTSKKLPEQELEEMISSWRDSGLKTWEISNLLMNSSIDMTIEKHGTLTAGKLLAHTIVNLMDYGPKKEFEFGSLSGKVS